METDRHTQRATTSGLPAAERETSPGKRTLTEGLAVQRHDAGERPAGAAAASPPASPPRPMDGARPTLQMLFGVQRMATAAAEDPAQVHAAAERGTATRATRLPYADQIQRAFGRHDISGIQAHTGPEAAVSARAMGAAAYATGHHVVLGGGTDLHTVAHEAAHVVQQRGGVQLKAGVGESGDAYEQHADQVADAVVQGKSAEGLLDRYSGGGHASEPATQHSLQRKTLAAEAAALADDAAAAASPAVPRSSRAVIQRLQVTWARDIAPVMQAAATGGHGASGASRDPFADIGGLVGQMIGVPEKKRDLMTKIKAQNEAEVRVMVDELTRLHKLDDVGRVLGAEFGLVLTMHREGSGARDYHALVKRYETADPASADERDRAVQAVARLGDAERLNVAHQVTNRRTWATISPRLGAAFDTLIATEHYNNLLKRFEGATKLADDVVQQFVLPKLIALDDFAFHKLLGLLSTTKAAHAPAMSIALGPKFDELVGTKLMTKAEDPRGRGAVTVIGELSDVELRALARYIVNERKGHAIHDRVGSAAHDAAVGKELESRFYRAIEAEFMDGTAKAVAIMKALSAYELSTMLDQMRATSRDTKHVLDVSGAKSKEVGEALGGHHYESLLKRFADGATPSGPEKLDINAQVGRLHDFELAMLTSRIRTENKSAMLIAKFGDPFKESYHEGLRVLFDRSTELAAQYALIKERFGIEFGKNTGGTKPGIDWDKKGLAQAWDVLQRLPPTQVIGNDKLAKILRYDIADPGDLLGLDEQGVGGSHSADKMKIGYDTQIESTENVAADDEPLKGVNRFDKVVRHEVGHAVEKKHNLAAAYCIGNPSGGNWQKHDSMDALAALFVAQAPTNVVIRTWGNPQKTKIVTKLAAILGSENTSDAVDTRLDELANPPNSLSASEIARVKTDGGVEAIRIAMAKGSPWYNHDTGGIRMANGRIYVQSYGDQRGGDWVSYDAAARARSLSAYQFRSPGEWFAEAYACYYEPGPATGAHLGRKAAANQANGALLQARDATTKAWFDLNVATK